MKICEMCYSEFDEDDAASDFEEDVRSRYRLDYNNLTKTLCAYCAIEAYENGYGIYQEICYSCDKPFDPEPEYKKFDRLLKELEIDGDILGQGICCAACSIKRRIINLHELKQYYKT